MERPDRDDFHVCGCLDAEENVAMGLPADWRCGGCEEFEFSCEEFEFASDWMVDLSTLECLEQQAAVCREGSSEFPHACPRCGQRAYVGFVRVNHAASGSCPDR